MNNLYRSGVLFPMTTVVSERPEAPRVAWLFTRSQPVLPHDFDLLAWLAGGLEQARMLLEDRSIPTKV
jgi:hypothetical protein